MPDGQDQVLEIDGASPRPARDSPFDCSSAGIQIDHHLPLLAAIRIGNGGAGHRDQLGSQEVQADVVQLLLRRAPCPKGASCRIGTLEAL